MISAIIDCDEVRGCISAGPGIDYDPATGVIGAGISPAPDNTVEVAPDGGLFVPPTPVDCAEVRGCISAGPGVDFDPATGVIGANISSQAGNNVAVGPDGGLYVPTGAATVETGCGITGDGSGSAPLELATGEWPFDCPVDDAGAGVYCGTDGTLRSEPLPKAGFYASDLALSHPERPLIPEELTQVASLDIELTNPDPCREALVILFQEADVDMNFPINGEGGVAIDTDSMLHIGNRGNGGMVRQHVQVSKLINVVLAPGETRTQTMTIEMARGSNGASYSRIQGTLRAWVISNPTA
ncbi:hypothetical protein HTV80_00170 [Streptomyces sp. Vc74B-19]|uniref:hypothetical protein n=1 Tax=Streptomyces sp. Vc74B-19 TaxID=2741324 RepID=UPI001BFC0FD2|nr:hypothetical protein [Streptomyces sp. Vc74B-19]MBT3161529.1 hypothetical protein [Streptomyces sp. Vc74B-19]